MTTRIRTILLVATAVVLVASCGSSDESASSVDPSGREWVLEELRGEPAMDGVQVDLTVTDDQISGSSGCNRYIGAADVSDGSLSIESELAMTMMACDDDVTAQEQAYLAALESVTGYEATQDELRLLDADGAVVVRFV